MHASPSPLLMGPNSQSSFISYTSWFEGVQGFLLERSGTNCPLFPGVLPYPEIIRSGVVGAEGQLNRLGWAKRFMNTSVCWSNFVSLGCPSAGGRYEPRGGYRCLAEMRDFADKLLAEVVEFGDLELLSGVLACEGKRGIIDELLSQVQCTVGACYADFRGPGDGEAGVPTLPVRAERIAVPEVAGTVDPCVLLDPVRSEVVANLDRLRKPECEWDEVVRAFHQVPRDEEDKVVRRLLSTKMAVLVPESELPCNSRGRLLVGGLFSVLKNEREDRLIFDRRPENATMHRLRWAKLPSGACFTKLLLGECEYLRGSGDDLRNYYYMLRLPSNWVRFNAAGRRVSAQVLREQGLDPRVPHRACFAVLGMGDKNGCDIAQAVHESLLQRHGLLRSECTLQYGTHLPEGELLEGVYLDDLLIAKRRAVANPVPVDGSFVPPAARPRTWMWFMSRSRRRLTRRPDLRERNIRLSDSALRSKHGVRRSME